MGRSFALILAFVAGLTCSPIIFPDGVGPAVRSMINSIRSEMPIRNSGGREFTQRNALG